MIVEPLRVVYLVSEDGRCPYTLWLESLDAPEAAMVDARLLRVRRGLLGDHKSVGGGVFEFRFNEGPGYRLYFGRDGRRVVVLLNGGSKKNQGRDIIRARGLWKEYLGRGSP